MTIITQTIYARALAAQRKIGQPYELLPYSTINEALDNPQAVPNQAPVPTAGREVFAPYDAENDTNSYVMRYMTIGNNGHRTVFGANLHGGMPAPMDWAANNSGMYWMLPFIIVEADHDLSQSERQKYCLRKVHYLNGQYYIGYYGLVISFPTGSPEYRIYRKENNVITDSAVFTPSMDQLVPTHPTGDLTNNKTHVSVTQPYSAMFTTEMINNIVNACNLLYGTSAAAVISEIGICSAVEKTVTARYPLTGTQNPSPITPGLFRETVGMQIDTHVSLVQPISFNHTGFGVDLQVGGGVPLYPTSSTED